MDEFFWGDCEISEISKGWLWEPIRGVISKRSWVKIKHFRGVSVKNNDLIHKYFWGVFNISPPPMNSAHTLWTRPTPYELGLHPMNLTYTLWTLPTPYELGPPLCHCSILWHFVALWHFVSLWRWHSVALWHFVPLWHSVALGHSRKDPHLPHGGNRKWHPPPFGHPRTAEAPPSPRTSKPKMIPPSDICYSKWFNKSNILNFDKLSVTSVGASAPQHVFAANCSNMVTA